MDGSVRPEMAEPCIMDGSVQFSSRWYLRARKNPHALSPIVLKFPPLCLSETVSVFVSLTMVLSLPFKEDSGGGFTGLLVILDS